MYSFKFGPLQEGLIIKYSVLWSDTGKGSKYILGNKNDLHFSEGMGRCWKLLNVYSGASCLTLWDLEVDCSFQILSVIYHLCDLGELT